MAKKIRFPLQMKGTDVRTIEELRDKFDLECVLGYFTNGKLVTWLKDRYYDNEATAIEALSADDAELNQKIMSILGISIDTEAEDIDIEVIQRRNEKLILLRQITDDKEIIDNVDYVAFNQDDLLDILDEGAEKIYLCQGEFDIPLAVKNVTYIGLKNPIVLLRAYDNVNFSSLNIKLINICFGWDISSITSNDRLYQIERKIEKREYDGVIPALEQLVAEKNPRAFCVLDVVYGKVFPAKENGDKQFALYEKGAELGDALMWIEAGRNFPEMEKLLHKLVKKGNKTAMGYLAYHYFVNEDFDKVVIYGKMGADKNDLLSCECIFYVCKDDCGKKVPEHMVDINKALSYGEKAALLGHADIANKMGVIYANGEIVQQNYEKAFKFYSISAEQGNHYAQYNLACCYETEKGVKQDYTKAAYWLEKAIASGDADALMELGYCYEKGLGTVQDYKRAFELYEKAANAEKPNITAQNNLGFLYQHGNGVAVDLKRALYWYDKAASAGNEAAKNNAEYVRNEMSRIEIDTSPEDELRVQLKRLGEDLRSELSSITDELRRDGFFNIMGN